MLRRPPLVKNDPSASNTVREWRILMALGSTSAALIIGPSGMGYTLTKHGALGFAEWVALNYSHLGVTVTCRCPNAVNTGMLGRDEDGEAEADEDDKGPQGPTLIVPPSTSVRSSRCARR